jgi:hypothetical protein
MGIVVRTTVGMPSQNKMLVAVARASQASYSKRHNAKHYCTTSTYFQEQSHTYSVCHQVLRSFSTLIALSFSRHLQSSRWST